MSLALNTVELREMFALVEGVPLAAVFVEIGQGEVLAAWNGLQQETFTLEKGNWSARPLSFKCQYLLKLQKCC